MVSPWLIRVRVVKCSNEIDQSVNCDEYVQQTNVEAMLAYKCAIIHSRLLNRFTNKIHVCLQMREQSIIGFVHTCKTASQQIN